MKPILQGLKVHNIGHGGIGIASLPDGKKVLIKGGALPGSTVDVKVVKKRKDFIEAHIIETQNYDPHFADGEIFCPHYFIPRGVSEVNAGTAKIGCGGCKWQMMSYERQLELKQQLVEESFKKITKTHSIKFLPIIGSPLTQGYRNKIEFSFGVYKQQSEAYREWKKQHKSIGK